MASSGGARAVNAVLAIPKIVTGGLVLLAIGTMLYGFDWPSGGGPDHPATALPFGAVQALLQKYGITPAYDPDKDSWHFKYTDASGVPHEVWYSDAPVVNRRVDLAHQHGFTNGFWRIGQEDERIWSNPDLPGASG